MLDPVGYVDSCAMGPRLSRMTVIKAVLYGLFIFLLLSSSFTTTTVVAVAYVMIPNSVTGCIPSHGNHLVHIEIFTSFPFFRYIVLWFFLCSSATFHVPVHDCSSYCFCTPLHSSATFATPCEIMYESALGQHFVPKYEQVS